jgi:hypothetical protein
LARKAKYKKLTNREKEIRRETKHRLQEQGILPPSKPRLNRKKFATEVINEFEEGFNFYTDAIYFVKALGCVLPGKWESTITPEQIGIFKVLKLAVEIKKFSEEKIAQGETEYTLGELYDRVVAPVLKL